MKLFKIKHRPQPETAFEKMLHSQPVYNWFDRYKKPTSIGKHHSAKVIELKVSNG